MQVGYVGLLKAISNFDPAAGQRRRYPVAGAEAGPSHPRADQDHGHAAELV